MTEKARELTIEQQAQEELYLRPYHYFIDKFSHEGIFYFSYIDKCLDIVKSFKNKTILDAGCGDGFFISNLDDSNNFIYGLDYSSRALDFARLFNKDKKSKFVQGTLEAIPFGDNYFDIITNIAVLEHIKPANVNLCLKEMHRVLKKNGFFILVIPTHNLKKPPKHFQHFDLEEIKQYIEPFFIIKEIYGKYNMIFRFLLKFFENKFYNIRPLSNIIKRKIFIKYFADSSLRLAEIMIFILTKR
ncbi:MAG: class I SAM-dependent methyltransferase [Candidatus Margulisbacteria bacterium]|nr:class I SAM-dependent methyltransferase [Candidatus Margulisiibacteriota bacterium]